MTYHSKYGIGARFVLAGCPCVISSVEFKNGSEETYTVQWVNPFSKPSSRMTRTELENSIKIDRFLSKHNGNGNERESLDSYDAIVREWAEDNAVSK